MRKRILTVATAFLLVVTGVYAENKANSNAAVTTTDLAEDIGINSFCKAIMQGDVETVKKFIELGEDVNQKSLGMTPAIFAARYNKAEILQLLVENGADLKIRCDKGYTAKKHAELSGAKDALAVIENAMKS